MFRPVLLLALLASASAAPSVHLIPGAGYAENDYSSLRSTVQAALTSSRAGSTRVCLAHSQDGAETLLAAAASGYLGDQCDHGLVLLGAVPTSDMLSKVSQDVLVVHGHLDGVTTFSTFAVARHQATTFPASTSKRVTFASLDGGSHSSFVNAEAPLSALAREADLRPAIPHDQVHAEVAAIVSDFVGQGSRFSTDGTALARAEARAAGLAAPVVAALKLEGSPALGAPSCNSDFPTNPTCQYPKWPDHSLPPGPAKPPAPLPPADCVCGSPWVAQVANELIAGVSESKRPSAMLTTKDAFQDVSDVHPFHLPHIFNSCQPGNASSSSCTLNMTTLTMPIYKAGDLFPNASSGPVSAFEMRTKLKSRQAVWEALGLGPQDSGKTDKNMSMCRDVNDRAWRWALQHADADVRARFEKEGEPFVMVDDKPATIGITGPEWIKDELVYTRVKGNSAGGSAAASRIEVQSWQFVVGNTNQGHLPWFFPVGMHYCKFMSPARAMEWIYSDGLRQVRAF